MIDVRLTNVPTTIYDVTFKSVYVNSLFSLCIIESTNVSFFLRGALFFLPPDFATRMQADAATSYNILLVFVNFDLNDLVC